jgi:signal transduction histidine kinase
MSENNSSLQGQDAAVAALEPRRLLFKTINDFALNLMTVATETDLVWYVAREVVGRLGFDDCVIYFVVPERTLLRQVAAIGAKNPHSNQIINALEIPIGSGVTGHVAKTKQPLIIDDLRLEDRYIPDVEPALSEICVPLIIDDEVVGVIDCQDPRQQHFDQEHLKTLTMVAALTSAKLKMFAETRRVEEQADQLQQANAALTAEIAERVRTEKALRDSETQLEEAIEALSEGFIYFDADDRLIGCNSKHRELFPSYAEFLKPGVSFEFLLRKQLENIHLPWAVGREEEWIAERLAKHRSQDKPVEQVFEDGRIIRLSEYQTRSGGTVSIRADITELKQAQEQLRQAQKLQAIGQLTGGVAHDFNNLLAVIFGHAELLEDRLGSDDHSIQAVIRAARRGAELTQRLLAYSRRQPLQPKPIALGELAHGMSNLLRRTLGETIEVQIISVPGLWRAKADPGQLENALLNLAINARDAMLDSGNLTIEITNATFDEDDVGNRTDVAVGDYVMLSVSDTGSGMAKEVLEQAFEPFFTTKDVGEGSGLGLSMVYGFAKQSGGDVEIQSDPGNGTTVKLYLPRSTGNPGQAKQESARLAVPRGQGETILVVEDDAEVRLLVETMLREFGYRVLTAENASAAKGILQAGSPIDLLLSDVVLPGDVSGPGLVAQLRQSDPLLKVLFMSGYSEGSFGRQIALPESRELLSKPFRKPDLARKVRDILDLADPVEVSADRS